MKKLFIILMIILMPFTVLAQDTKEVITVDPTDGFDMKEILQDIQNKSFVDSVNQVELKEVKADGGKWYLANVREVKDDNTAVYRNIHFYVVDEGLETEKAYYKDEIPTEITKGAIDFTEKLTTFIEQSTDLLRQVQIFEDKRFAIVEKFILNETSKNYQRKQYIAKEDIKGLITLTLIEG
jgi:hypothetical protein